VNTIKTKELSQNPIQHVKTSAHLGHVTYLFKCCDFRHLLKAVPKTVITIWRFVKYFDFVTANKVCGR
jgi:hypothetical protein